MSSEMNIRHAAEADLAAIVAIYNASIPAKLATADTEPVTIEARRPWFEKHRPDSRPLWVLEASRDAGDEARRIAGWLSFGSFYGRPAYLPTVEVGLYVHPDFARRGVAKALLRHAIDSAPALGVQTLLAFIFGHNDPSLRLFEAFGFTRWGKLPSIAHMPDGRRDLDILGLHLKEPDARPPAGRG